MVLSEAGHALAVWAESEGDRATAWTSRSAPGEDAWSEPERLDLDGMGDVLIPRLAVDREATRSPPGRAATRRAWDPGCVPTAPPTRRGIRPDASMEPLSEFVEIGVSADGHALAIWLRDGSKLVASQLR